jgi:hypothetical protein
MYKGHLTIKELKSMFGNKAATQFTVAEFMQATFLHTFVGGFINDERKIVHDHTVGFLPSVNSDKNTIGQILIDLNLPCSRFEKSPRYFELTQNQIATLIAEELGDSYKLTREGEDGTISFYNDKKIDSILSHRKRLIRYLPYPMIVLIGRYGKAFLRKAGIRKRKNL